MTMTNEEILEKYRDLINTDITKYIEEYDLKTVLEQQEFAALYKRNFVKSFREGAEEIALEVARRMLAKGRSINEIIEFTELTTEQIEKL